MIESLSRQEKCDPSAIEIVVIDNGTSPPLNSELLSPLLEAKMRTRLIFEPRLGISNARYCGILKTSSPWILFVDDDNELSRDYVYKGLEFISAHPDVGCFGGKLLLPPSVDVPPWANQFLPFLGIRDIGDETRISTSIEWTECEPPGAGAWVRRDVAELYARRLDQNSALRSLGRSSSSGFASGDDSCMMRGAATLGLASAYYPELRLLHHIAPHRLTYGYLLKLFAGYGQSTLILERALNGSHPNETSYSDPNTFSKQLDDILFDKKKEWALEISTSDLATERPIDVQRGKRIKSRRSGRPY